MALGLAAGQANTYLDSVLKNGTPFMQLHTAAPGAAGTTAIATNSTRKAVTFGTASGGVATTTADVVWTNVSTTETYTHFSLFTASSAGTFLMSGTITGGAVTAGNTFTAPTGTTVTIPVAS